MNKKQIIQEYLLEKLKEKIEASSSDLHSFRTFFINVQKDKNTHIGLYIKRHQELLDYMQSTFIDLDNLMQDITGLEDEELESEDVNF